MGKAVDKTYCIFYHSVVVWRTFIMTDYKEYEDVATEDYIVVKALSEGVQVIGLTRGGETRSHHTEMLDAGEVLVAQFTTKTSAIKIRGDAEILTKHGAVRSNKK